MAKTTQEPAKSYQALRTELAELLAELQQDDLDLTLALDKYRHGLALVAELEKQLATAENEVVTIQAKFDAGA